MLVALTSSADRTGPSQTEPSGSPAAAEAPRQRERSERLPGEPSPGGGGEPTLKVTMFSLTTLQQHHVILLGQIRAGTGFTGTGRNGPVCFNGMVESICIPVHLYTSTAGLHWSVLKWKKKHFGGVFLSVSVRFESFSLWYRSLSEGFNSRLPIGVFSTN